jgi:hypothetical protein
MCKGARVTSIRDACVCVYTVCHLLFSMRKIHMKNSTYMNHNNHNQRRQKSVQYRLRGAGDAVHGLHSVRRSICGINGRERWWREHFVVRDICGAKVMYLLIYTYAYTCIHTYFVIRVSEVMHMLIYTYAYTYMYTHIHTSSSVTSSLPR